MKRGASKGQPEPAPKPPTEPQFRGFMKRMIGVPKAEIDEAEEARPKRKPRTHRRSD